MKKWEQDLIKDIRFHNSIDDIDSPVASLGFIGKSPYAEFTEDNHKALQTAINRCKLNGLTPKTFLEIGICRNNEKSSTFTILKNLPSDGKYLGVDIEDKTYLDDHQRGIYTLKENSSNYDSVVKKLNEIGIYTIDFIFIDGWHSINQVYDDWEYTALLTEGGVVAFHDTTAHPGPAMFIRNLDISKWVVEPNICTEDHGLGYCFKKK